MYTHTHTHAIFSSSQYSAFLFLFDSLSLSLSEDCCYHYYVLLLRQCIGFACYALLYLLHFILPLMANWCLCDDDERERERASVCACAYFALIINLDTYIHTDRQRGRERANDCIINLIKIKTNGKKYYWPQPTVNCIRLCTLMSA